MLKWDTDSFFSSPAGFMSVRFKSQHCLVVNKPHVTILLQYVLILCLGS